MVATETELREARTAWAEAYHHKYKHWPLILHQDCYEYLGRPASIVEAYLTDRVKHCDVVLFVDGEKTGKLSFSQLRWRTYPSYEPQG